MNREIFDPIMITVPTERIYTRLGYSKTATVLTSKQKKQVDAYLEEAVSLVTLKGVAVRLPIKVRDSKSVILGPNIVLRSQAVSKLLEDSLEVLLLGATAGNEIIYNVQKSSKAEDLTAAVVYDAVASEMVDEALGWMIGYHNTILRREYRAITKRRFSAGYGDFGMENQKTICEVLRMDELGVSLNDNFILSPEKSVTTVAGISKGHKER